MTLEEHKRRGDTADALFREIVRRTMGPAVAVELRLRDGAGSVLCDPNEWESALLNLCINARDAMPEGGRLVIGTEDMQLSASEIADEGIAPDSYTALSVADTGMGMSPDVFEPFFTTQPQGQGRVTKRSAEPSGNYSTKAKWQPEKASCGYADRHRGGVTGMGHKVTAIGLCDLVTELFNYFSNLLAWNSNEFVGHGGQLSRLESLG